MELLRGGSGLSESAPVIQRADSVTFLLKQQLERIRVNFWNFCELSDNISSEVISDT